MFQVGQTRRAQVARSARGQLGTHVVQRLHVVEQCLELVGHDDALALGLLERILEFGLLVRRINIHLLFRARSNSIS